MHITHHITQKDLIVRALKNYETLKDSAMAQVKEGTVPDINYLADCCLDVFFCKAFLQEDKDNTALQDFVDTLTASLNFPLHKGKTITYKLRNKQYQVTPAGEDYYVSFHIWNMAFLGATLLNDPENLKILTEMNFDKLAELHKKKKNYTYSMSVALKAFHLKQKNFPELLQAALQENMDVPEKDPLYDKALDIDGPALELLYLLLQERNEQFNERLQEALEWHKKYAARLEKKDMQDNTVLISLPICTMVVLAKRIKNFTIDHSSEYLPGYLLNV